MSERKILSHEFYKHNTLKVAKELLGKYLVRKVGRKKIIGQIIETEAYCGPKDLACHGSRGRTPRTEALFGQAGQWYVYFIYGMYYCLNVVTEKKDYPSAALIRAVKPIYGINGSEKTDGPGKLCRTFKIDKKLNNSSACSSFSSPLRRGRLGGGLLWIEDWGEKIKPSQIKKTPRIGVDYAKEYKNKPWRFILKFRI
ncbi:MAG: DNA-3-methyladenine glycosylase [Patescibacteria group bacterium]